MFSFLKRRWFVLLIGLLLIAIFIWYAGPYFGFGDYHPLETEFARLMANVRSSSSGTFVAE